MALLTWADTGGNAAVTNARMNTWLAERPDSGLYGAMASGPVVAGLTTTKAYAVGGEKTRPASPQLAYTLDVLVGQYLCLAWEQYNFATAGDMQFEIRVVAGGRTVWSITGAQGNVGWAFLRYLLDLRDTGDGGDCDGDARGMQATVEWRYWHTIGGAMFARGLSLMAGNTGTATDYGDVD